MLKSHEYKHKCYAKVHCVPTALNALLHKRLRVTIESSSKRGSVDKVSSRHESRNFENWKLDIENLNTERF